VVAGAAPLCFCEEVEEEDDFLFLLLWMAFATASLNGNYIWDGWATTRLLSVLLAVAFFNLFFGVPLQRKID
jgi:hypothetical protein